MLKRKNELLSVKIAVGIVVFLCLFSIPSGALPHENQYDERNARQVWIIKNIAMWDGNAWNALDCGRNRTVFALEEYENDLMVGGIFDPETDGQDPPFFINDSVVRWDGTAWSLLRDHDDEPFIADVHTLTIYNNQLIAGGFFYGESGIHGIGYYNPSDRKWHELGNGGVQNTDGQQDVLTLTTYQEYLVVGGKFKFVGGDSIIGRSLALWDGVSWYPLGTQINGTLSYISASAVIGDDLYIGGLFETGEEGICKNLAIYGHYGVGGSLGWSDQCLITDIDGSILTIGEYNGDVIIGGFFTTVNGIPVNHLARWDGNQWHAFDNGVTGDEPGHTQVHAMIVYQGDLIIGGCFSQAGTTEAQNIARWNGSGWSTYGDVFEQPFIENMWDGIYAFHEFNGNLIAAGNFINDGPPGPHLELTITGGSGLHILVGNNGDADAYNVAIFGTVEDALFIKPRDFSFLNQTIRSGETWTAKIPLFGFGMGFLFDTPTITVTASRLENETHTISVPAKIFLWRIRLV